ncbi:hyoscyamine 6-dioxygenase-like [Cornus florida]|uniref:hyoscyamine 6-dioxygenase-like n=1 Tax=Cornus florida TaxID=4283 RepID=UPI0028A11A63|nr:hyoscyamine 6-dioxygenase-like [Cornus florida]
MVKLISSWCKDVQSIPKNYVQPPDLRPGELIFPVKSGPVVDLSKALGQDRAGTIQQIMQAGQEFGFFQVINHGVSGSLMQDAKSVLKEFFDMPDEVKSSVFTPDASKKCRLYSSSAIYLNEEILYWRDNLTHPCHPLEDCVQLMPGKPTRYREVVGTYSVEVRKMIMRILDLICEGLGLELGYFGGDLSKFELLGTNLYPRCPEPSLALGTQIHCDPNLVSILNQGGVSGLQVCKDGEWFLVEPIPNAFMFLIGCQLQIITNDKIRGVEHRVVTNSKEDRISIGYFVLPTYECVIEPAKALVSTCNPPLYKTLQYTDILKAYAEKNGSHRGMMESHKLQVE